MEERAKAYRDTSSLREAERIDLARHCAQRTRRDIEHDWEGDHCFPRRDPSDETYRLSQGYQDLFGKTYDFCAEMVKTGQSLTKRQQRVRYWGALALLRCVMSSPAAAVAALATRHDALVSEDGEPPVESAEATLDEAGRRRLRELGRMAASPILSGTNLAWKLLTVSDRNSQAF